MMLENLGSASLDSISSGLVFVTNLKGSEK